MDDNPITPAVSSHVYVEVDDEAPVKNTIRMVEGALEAFPSPEELATQGGWMHAAPFLLSTGILGGSGDRSVPKFRLKLPSCS